MYLKCCWIWSSWCNLAFREPRGAINLALTSPTLPYFIFRLKHSRALKPPWSSKCEFPLKFPLVQHPQILLNTLGGAKHQEMLLVIGHTFPSDHFCWENLNFCIVCQMDRRGFPNENKTKYELIRAVFNNTSEFHSLLIHFVRVILIAIRRISPIHW